MRHSTALAALALALTAACASNDNADPLAPASSATPVSAPLAAAKAPTVRLTAVLTGTGFVSAKGKMQWKSSGTHRELQGEVENLRRIVGRTVTFRIGGVPVATGVVDALGVARFSLSTEKGDAVPTHVTGKRADARTPSGRSIAAGTF